MSANPLIAIVDDDESIREALHSLLRSVGLRAEVCASAEDFLQSGRLPDTACLIVDVRMPHLSGLELQRQLITAHCPIPLIFITAHEDEETRQRALRAGAIDFLYNHLAKRSCSALCRQRLFLYSEPHHRLVRSY
jgi:FixJ family two-component response regulator